MSKMHTIRFRLVIAVVAVAASLTLLTACGGSSQGNDSAVGAGTSSGGTGSGVANVTLTADPEPMRTSQPATLTVRLTDAEGKGVAGATVGVVAENAAMSMGKLSGVVTDVGDGTYTITITPSMAGTWKVTVTADIGSTSKQATFEVPAE